jgi:outer membrane lipoprotein-sorting protein
MRHLGHLSKSLGLALAAAAAIFLIAPRPSAAEAELTAEDLVRETVAAQGGEERWSAVRSMKWTGQYSTFSAKKPFTLLRKRPNLYRFEYFYGDWPIVLGYDGGTAWTIDKTIFTPVDWAVEAPLPVARAIAGDAELGGPLMDYEARGHTVELVGREDLDGLDVYHLRVTLAGGSVESWYLDAGDYLPAVRVSQTFELGQFYEQRTYFSDYREVGGLRLPHSLEIEFGSRYQAMEVESVELDVDLDDRVFALLPPEGMERLQGLSGDWRVVVSSRPVPQMPWLEVPTEAVIEARFHGGLLEEEIRFVAAGSPRAVRRQTSYDRFRDVYRITCFDSLTSHVDVLEGGFDDSGRLVASNVDTGTGWTAKGRTVHHREVISDIQPDSFRLDWEVSLDGGETWLPELRFSYVRRQPTAAQ